MKGPLFNKYLLTPPVGGKPFSYKLPALSNTWSPSRRLVQLVA